MIYYLSSGSLCWTRENDPGPLQADSKRVSLQESVFEPGCAMDKPFVISRKNFLFANTPGGARCSAILFSMIETAKENGLDPYRYLTWVLTESPKRAAAGSVWAAELTPQHAPSQCKATSDN